jgi:hypothetical protein
MEEGSQASDMPTIHPQLRIRPTCNKYWIKLMMWVENFLNDDEETKKAICGNVID